RESDQSNPQAQDQGTSEPEQLAPTAALAETALPQIAKIEAPAVTPPPQPEPVVGAAPAVTPEPTPIVVAIEPSEPEVAMAEPAMPLSADVRPAAARADDTITPAAAPSLLSGWTTSSSWARTRRAAPLAATIVIAAAL